MIDINFIRKNPDEIKKICKNRQVAVDIDRLLDVDQKKRELMQKLEAISAQKNKSSKEISADPAKKQELILKMKELDKTGDGLRENLKDLESEFEDLMYKVPNTYLKNVPVGKDETENKVIKKWGVIPKFSFKIKDHIELGEMLDIIDIKKAGEISGARFNYLKNEAALLEFALINFVFAVLTSEKTLKKIAKKYNAKSFAPVIPPAMIRPEIFKKMGRLSEKDKNERYHFGQDDLYLIGSAEHTLGPIHLNETILEKDLPLRYVGFSPSFRREAGSYGKDTKGILRVHQFDKIEMESFSLPEDSVKEQDFIISIQEYLVQALKLPYQVVSICTGDMALPDARQVDIEVWIPSQNKYRETHTSDLMTDYQARRLNTRVKRLSGKTEFAHMNDATAFAIGRILVAILENYQQKDGSVKIPRALHKYLNFKAIKPKKDGIKRGKSSN